MEPDLLSDGKFYKSIRRDFYQKYQAEPAKFLHHLQAAFERARSYNKDNGINSVFTRILRKDASWSNEEIKQMIDLGVNPKTLEEMGFFFVSLYHSTQTDYVDILNLLLDHGLQLTDHDIRCQVYRMAFIDLLISRGYDVKLILERIAGDRNMCAYLDQSISTFIIDHKDIFPQLSPDTLFDLFMIVMAKDGMTISALEVFVNAGVVLNHSNEAFIWSCYYTNSKLLPEYFLTNYDVDINANNGLALSRAIECQRLDTIQLLLDSNITVLDQHILIAFKYPRATDILVQSGRIGYERLAELIMKKLFSENSYCTSVLQRCIDNNVDLSQVVASLLRTK